MVAAVTFVLLLLVAAGIFALLLIIRKRRDEASDLYSGKLQRRMAPLFDQYKYKYWFSSGPIFFLLFVQAVFVGAGQVSFLSSSMHSTLTHNLASPICSADTAHRY